MPGSLDRSADAGHSPWDDGFLLEPDGAYRTAKTHRRPFAIDCRGDSFDHDPDSHPIRCRWSPRSAATLEAEPKSHAWPAPWGSGRTHVPHCPWGAAERRNAGVVNVRCWPCHFSLAVRARDRRGLDGNRRAGGHR
jgi:hypothetical protein